MPPRRTGIVTVDVCPACGYPTLGPALCAFCRPAATTALLPSRDSVAGLDWARTTSAEAV